MRARASADALVVVDVQQAFVSGASAVPACTTLLTAVGQLVERARAAAAPVIQLQNDGPLGAPDERGTLGWELAVPANATDVVVPKSADDGFVGTRLEQLLHERDVSRVAFCGMLSEMCLAATIRSALARGFAAVLAHEAHATYDVPAGPGSAAVPAHLAARAAEWSLGDAIELVATTDQVTFTPRGVKD